MSPQKYRQQKNKNFYRMTLDYNVINREQDKTSKHYFFLYT